MYLGRARPIGVQGGCPLFIISHSTSESQQPTTAMSTTAIAIPITYAVLSSTNLYISYTSGTYIPRDGPYEPYLSVLGHLIPLWLQAIALWTPRPFLALWFSSLRNVASEKNGSDIGPQTRDAVDHALNTYQALCATLLGIVVVPFIWTSRHEYLKQLESDSNGHGYAGYALWCLASFTCVCCFLRKSISRFYSRFHHAETIMVPLCQSGTRSTTRLGKESCGSWARQLQQRQMVPKNRSPFATN